MPNQHTPPIPVEQRFWSKVDKSGGPDACWPWRGTHAGRGYGAFSVKHHPVRAHRFAYAATYGPVPSSVYICHTCDNPGCVNPAHLYAGSPASNMADKVARGRQARGEQIRNRHQQRGDDHWTHQRAVPTKGERNGSAKLTEADVRSIRAQAAAGVSQYRLAKDFGISQVGISLIVRRVNWKHVA